MAADPNKARREEAITLLGELARAEKDPGSSGYRHVSGIEVVYRPNAWTWQVIGGPDDGHAYSTLSVAQHAATKATR